MIEFHKFEPIIFHDSKILILGTFPSIKSFENNFYYSNPKNQFWKLLEKSFNEEINDKKLFLKKHKIALWDIIKSASRTNSSDTSLKNIELHDINALLLKYPNIKTIAFTSKTAQKLFNKLNIDINTYYLPSPSPAYAKMKFDEKLSIYKHFFKSQGLI